MDSGTATTNHRHILCDERHTDPVGDREYLGRPHCAVCGMRIQILEAARQAVARLGLEITGLSKAEMIDLYGEGMADALWAVTMVAAAIRRAV